MWQVPKMIVTFYTARQQPLQKVENDYLTFSL